MWERGIRKPPLGGYIGFRWETLLIINRSNGILDKLGLGLIDVNKRLEFTRTVIFQTHRNPTNEPLPYKRTF